MSPAPAPFAVAGNIMTPHVILLKIFTVEGKRMGPQLGIWPLTFPNILSP